MPIFTSDLKATIVSYAMAFTTLVILISACVAVPALATEAVYAVGLFVGVALLNLFRAARNWAEAPPPPPIPRSHYVVFKEDFVYPAVTFSSELFGDLRNIDLAGLINGVLFLVIAVATTSLFLYVLRERLIRAAYRVRGIDVHTGEATVPGSVFMPLPMPACQVTIMRPGILVDTHMGYGFRYRNTLVFPQHVFGPAEMGGNILIAGKLGKAVVSVSTVRLSSHITDVCYLDINETVWSKVGVQKATIHPDELETLTVSITGTLGTSTGRLSKANIPWTYFYRGSTVAGYSGAPYMHLGRVVGMHAGVATDRNVGISAAACAIEIDTFVEGEKAGKRLSNHYRARPMTDESIRASQAMKERRREAHQQYWSTHNFLDEDYEEYETSPDRLDMTYDQWKHNRGYRAEAADEYDSIVEGLGDLNARLVLEALQRKFRDGGEVKYHPQGTETMTFGDISAGVDDSATMQMIMNLQQEVGTLKARVERLETTVTTKSAPPSPSKKHFKCVACSKMFKTQDGANVHAALVHKIVCTQPESALPGDSEVTVNLRPNHFLGKGRSPKMNGNQSLTTSTTSMMSSPSSPKSYSPPKTKTSQKELVEVFANFQKTILGLLEARGQSSAV